MLKVQPNSETRRAVELEVIKALRNEEYTLNTVNNYGENLLHISAASGCSGIVKEILKKGSAGRSIDRKNKFGWTPLMLAIRNRDINTVKLLIENAANTNESTYLGMSVLGLAAAINKEMFEIVYRAYPSALLNVTNDDITPLCIAAMRNDRDLFFKLLDLGFDISKANEYTQIMMKRSTIPEIASLATVHLDIEDYWNDMSDNIPIEANSIKTEVVQPSISRNESSSDRNNSLFNFPKRPILKFDFSESPKDNTVRNNGRGLKCKMNLMPDFAFDEQSSIISPTLTCNIDEVFPVSPNVCFLEENYTDKANAIVQNDIENISPIENQLTTHSSKVSKCESNSTPLQRLQSIRPSDLNIQNSPEDLNVTLGYIPEFSPIRSPHVPSDINDENVFGENTPTPPRYKTPPRGMILNSEEIKMFMLLKHYGLCHYAPIFIEQEVDVDLFMTLTDEDLIEIGVKHKSDRNIILSAIMDYRKLEA